VAELVGRLVPGVLQHVGAQRGEQAVELRRVGSPLLRGGEGPLGVLLLGEPVVDDVPAAVDRRSGERVDEVRWLTAVCAG